MDLTEIKKLLQQHGLRKTTQRLQVAQIIFEAHPTHWTADTLHAACVQKNIHLPLATIYNTLNQFESMGLLRKIHLQGNLCYFDTNLDPHHHLYLTESKVLRDIPMNSIRTEIDWSSALMSSKSGSNIPEHNIVIHVSG